MAASAIVATALTLEQIRKNRPIWQTSSETFDTFQMKHAKGEYNLDPSHQRGVVHNNEWKQEILSSALIDGDIPEVYWHPSEDGERLESLDGKQRCSAIIQYMNNEYKYMLKDVEGMHGKKFEDLEKHLKREIEKCTIKMSISNRRLTDEEVGRFFKRRQKTKTTTCGEHLNSSLESKWRKVAIQWEEDYTTKLTEALWNVHSRRYEIMERIAQIIYVSCEDGVKGRECDNSIKEQAERKYDVSSDKLKNWWSTSQISESKREAARKLLETVIRIQSGGIIFKSGNSELSTNTSKKIV